MHTPRADLTAKAIIRDEALRLFAAHGPDAVTIRQVAAAAGVSSALVIRHYQSKSGLRSAVDDHVDTVLEEVLAELARAQREAFDPARASGLAAAVARHLDADSPIPTYLARMLVDGQSGSAMFRRLYAASQQTLNAAATAGLADHGADPDARAAFLLANDLAVLMLRPHLANVLGIDPLTQLGMTRWAAQVLTIYAGGLSDNRTQL